MTNPATRPELKTYHLADAWQLHPNLSTLIPRILDNQQLTDDLKSLMPATLQSGWRVSFNDGKLLVKVAHQAIAVKIRQHSPFIVDGLRMLGWHIDDKITIKVALFNTPKWLDQPKAAVIKNPRILSVRSANAIHSTLQHLPDDSAMRRALAHLLTTHATPKS